MSIGSVSKKTQDRPLIGVYETSVKKSRSGAPTTTKGPHKTYTDGPPSHSNHSSKRSADYHAKVVGGDSKQTRKMNPTKTLKPVRSFPGLVN